jgi:hypothetical protein
MRRNWKLLEAGVWCGMKLDDFTQNKCNSGKNWQFRPKKFVRLDLERIAGLVGEEGAEIELETGSLLILRLGGVQLDVNSSGKIVAKTEDPEKAQEAFSKLVQCI